MDDIVEVVKNSPKLQEWIEKLATLGFLVKSVLNPNAYLPNIKKIRLVEKKLYSRLNAVAVGIFYYNQLCSEITCSVLCKGEEVSSKATDGLLTAWEKQIKKAFPDEAAELIKSCSIIGQYLEVTNRRSS